MLYHYLSGENWRHIFIVGDLHGCRDMLQQQLAAHHFDQQRDLVIGVGDLIDRGPDSAGCLALLHQPWFRCVRGNHEQMALDALSGAGSQIWRRNCGDWFYRMKGIPVLEVKRDLLRCHQLPLILQLQLAERVAVIAHADYPADEYAWGREVDTDALLWGRERVAAAQRGEGARIRGADDFYFGHTPLSAPLNAWNQHYIDTGAVFGNVLTLVQVQ